MTAPSATPVLESGDHLTRDEFHRRYCARPDIKKAELVEGIVYVASPVRVGSHGQPHGRVMGWLATYCSRHPDVVFGDNSTVRLDADNEVQPDAFLLVATADGPRIAEDDYVEGPPQLVVEIAASSASYDLHQKLQAYERNGVIEYVVWRTLDESIDWFRLKDGAYVRVEPDERGIVESEAFPGLRLHVTKMLAGDLAGVLAEVATEALGA